VKKIDSFICKPTLCKIFEKKKKKKKGFFFSDGARTEEV
jgi:hypothetical protein